MHGVSRETYEKETESSSERDRGTTSHRRAKEAKFKKEEGSACQLLLRSGRMKSGEVAGFSV